MHLSELTDALNRATGGDFQVVDGSCTIAVDDMIVNILEVEELEAILLYAKIAERPAEDSLAGLSEAMLAANHMFQGTGGGTISYNPEDRSYYLNRYDPEETLNGERFLAHLERFVNTLETWRKLVVDYRPESGKDGGAGDAPVAGDQGGLSGFNGFMQV